jgi:hypothetical protein
VVAAVGAWKAAHGVFAVLLVITVVVWMAAELRQALKRRPEAPRVEWGSESVLRVAVVAGVLVAVVAVLAERKVPAAAIGPAALAACLGRGPVVRRCAAPLVLPHAGPLLHPHGAHEHRPAGHLRRPLPSSPSPELCPEPSRGDRHRHVPRELAAGRPLPRLRGHQKAVGPVRLVSDVRRTAVAATPTRGVPSLWEGSPCDDGRGGRRSRSWPPR